MMMFTKRFDQLTDDELIAALNDGCERAFNEIYQRYWPGVYAVARNRIKNDDIAEEIVQRIFFNLWKRRIDFRLQQSLNGYFAIAVKYEVINHVSKKKKEADYLHWLQKAKSHADHSTEDTINFNELVARIEQSVCALPVRCQLVFRLRLEKDYSQKQIAQALDISEKSVEAHLAKARKQLRHDLGHSLPLIAALLLQA